MRNFIRYFSVTAQKINPKVCIVGSGPAGFYAAQHIFKKLPEVQIDLIERLPVPFGLVRYGVAPDHPEVKNVINTFTKTANNPKFQFFGNVSLGKDVSLQQLKDCYHAVLLSYGAEKDRELGIAGESLDNVISAREFVGWYNGVPENKNLASKLKGRCVAILGQGNVAIDVARILLTPVDQLRTTDITQYALNALSESTIEEVFLIGRRGPLQAAFTIKELREMLNLSNTKTTWKQDDFIGIEDHVSLLPRPKKRITELMLNSLKSQNDSIHKSGQKKFSPIFYKTPLDISRTSLKLATNMLIGDDITNQQTVITSNVEFLVNDLIIRSIGYKSVQVDSDIPFDEHRGVVKNVAGRVSPGLYTTGWLATGPSGVILTTMNNSFTTASFLCEDLKNSDLMNDLRPGYEGILNILKEKNSQYITWNGWEKIDKYEIEEGKKVGKCREKVTDIKQMLNIAC